MKYGEADSYLVDENTKITDLSDAPESSNFDSVICEVDGYHPAESGGKKIFNSRNQKTYYILEGNGEIHIDGDKVQVQEGEFVNVPKQTPHSLEGSFRALIVTSPPFDPEDEKLVE